MVDPPPSSTRSPAPAHVGPRPSRDVQRYLLAALWTAGAVGLLLLALRLLSPDLHLPL